MFSMLHTGDALEYSMLLQDFKRIAALQVTLFLFFRYLALITFNTLYE